MSAEQKPAFAFQEAEPGVSSVEHKPGFEALEEQPATAHPDHSFKVESTDSKLKMEDKPKVEKRSASPVPQPHHQRRPPWAPIGIQNPSGNLPAAGFGTLVIAQQQLPLQPDADEARILMEVGISSDELMPRMRTLLKPHQRDGVKRMLALEASPHKGGFLADEMGLGKTIQFLSMVAVGKCRGEELPTLIVVPGPSVLKEIEAQIRDHTKLSYFVFHGDHRPLQCQDWQNFEVVLSTYDMIWRDLPEEIHTTVMAKTWRQDFRAIPNAELKAMRDCGPIFKQHWGRIILDEAQ